MPHSLDVKRLAEVFDALVADDGQHLTAWELERLPEWKNLWESGRRLSDKQLECLEKMYLKV
jgi:hypothetical protein